MYTHTHHMYTPPTFPSPTVWKAFTLVPLSPPLSFLLFSCVLLKKCTKRSRVSGVLDYRLLSSDYKPKALSVRDKSSGGGGGLEVKMRGRCSGWGWGWEVTLETVEVSQEYSTDVKAPLAYCLFSVLNPIERTTHSKTVVQCLVNVPQLLILLALFLLFLCHFLTYHAHTCTVAVSYSFSFSQSLFSLL